MSVLINPVVEGDVSKSMQRNWCLNMHPGISVKPLVPRHYTHLLSMACRQADCAILLNGCC